MGRGAEDEIYLALVTANVLRLRRQWALAEAKCSEVLHREPENAAAYSLMGDISRDQAKLRDAIEWYKLALDRDPGSADDRKKLEAVIDQVFSGGGSGAGMKIRAKLGEMVERVRADVREAKMPLPALVVLVVAFAIIAVIAASAMLVGRGEGPSPELTGQQSPSGAFPVADAQEPVGRVEEAAPVRSRPSVAEELASKASAMEGALLEELRGRARMVDPNCRVVSAEVAPETGMVRLWLSMPRVWGAEATRRGIERVAVALAAEVADGGAGILGVRVRCDMRETDGTERMALMAEGSIGEVAKAREGTEGGMEEFFEFVWWDPELRV